MKSFSGSQLPSGVCVRGTCCRILNTNCCRGPYSLKQTNADRHKDYETGRHRDSENETDTAPAGDKGTSGQAEVYRYVETDIYMYIHLVIGVEIYRRIYIMYIFT